MYVLIVSFVIVTSMIRTNNSFVPPKMATVGVQNQKIFHSLRSRNYFVPPTLKSVVPPLHVTPFAFEHCTLEAWAAPP